MSSKLFMSSKTPALAKSISAHKPKVHPGFNAVEEKIEGEGYSKKSAGAILASKTRKASPAAKKANPNLKKVKG